MSSVIVLIPLYRAELSANEMVSVRQCFKTLSRHDICFVCPEGLDISNLEKLAETFDVFPVIERFAKKFFHGISGYSQLLLSTSFYQRFKKYKYILIHQTDVFIFKDELSLWCGKNYDYIGAPWINMDMTDWVKNSGLYPSNIKRVHKLSHYRLLKMVGNGGLSLRKTTSFINNLSFFKKAAGRWMGNEDGFFAHYVAALNPFFRIPNIAEALKFGIDAFPEQAMALNHEKLPFGCHAWFRKDQYPYTDNLSFWAPVIEKLSKPDLEVAPT